jgi:hypothetical protein
MLTWCAGVVMAVAAPSGASFPVAKPPVVVPTAFRLQLSRLPLAQLAPVKPNRTPRLSLREQASRDPQQFAALRALPLNRSGFRASPIDAKLEWKLSGDLGGVDSQIGVSGVPRLISRALMR